MQKEDEFWSEDDAPSPPITASTAGSSQLYTSPSSTSDVDNPGRNSDNNDTNTPKVNLIPFETLKGHLNYNTLKALIFKPFTLSAMSEVQRRVLTRMPYLSGGTIRDSVNETLELGGKDGLPIEGLEELTENEEMMQKGRQDLLVKAKTGTGKTIVRKR